MAGDRWLAVGDAALALDPLSSQGILTAMYSGMLAGRALDTHLSGNPKRLASYPSRLGAIATAYQRNRQAFYAMEWRWPDQAFWRRRTGPSRQVPSTLISPSPCRSHPNGGSA